MRLLFLIPDGYPTFRPDVSVLFGKYLPDNGIVSDLAAQEGADNRPAAMHWSAGELLICKRHSGQIRSQFTAFVHDVMVLWRAPRDRYDAMQVRDKVFAALVGLWKARALGIPFLYWMSFPVNELVIRAAEMRGFSSGPTRYVFSKSRARLAIWLLHKFVLPGANHVFVQSERMIEDVASLGISRGKMTAVPMCIDPERFERVVSPAEDKGRFEGRRVLAYLGACGKLNRTDFLIDMMETLRKSRPEVLLLLIGDAEEQPDEEWLREYIRKKGLHEHITITGWLSPEEAQKSLACAEVGLSFIPPDPLFYPATPTKLVEYLAMGKPVVANEHPDQTAVIRESGAGICVPFDREAFAGAIEAILSDPQMAARFSEAARAYAFSERNYRKMAANLADIYKRVTKKPPTM